MAVTAVLVMIAKTWKQPRCLSAGKQINKFQQWNIPNNGISVLKRNER